MNIVFLDSSISEATTFLSSELNNLGNAQIYSSSTPENIVERAKNADVLLTASCNITKEHLDALPTLKYIGVFATGTDCIDLTSASDKNIIVTNIPDYSTNAVAQGAMSLLLELTNHIGHYSEVTRNGLWTSRGQFSFASRRPTELSELTLGLVGFGKIAQRFAKLAKANDMRIVATNKSGKSINSPHIDKTVSFEELLQLSDVVSLHCPATNDTQEIINKRSISIMKHGAIIINTARGQLINEADLYEALKEGKLSGAGLDTMSLEPPPKNHPLFELDNCYITPHNSWSSKASLHRMLDTGVKNISFYAKGNPVNVVNKKSLRRNTNAPRPTI